MKYMYMCSYLYTHNICNQVFCTDTKKVNTHSITYRQGDNTRNTKGNSRGIP